MLLAFQYFLSELTIETQYIRSNSNLQRLLEQIQQAEEEGKSQLFSLDCACDLYTSE
jgi:hypothetical protein